MNPRYILATDTTRRFPRTLAQAFPWDHKTNAQGIEAPVIPCYAPWWVSLLRKFLNI